MRTASSTQALGTRQAIRSVDRSKIPAGLAAIETAGLKCERIDETSYRVAKKYTFFPATGFWRTDDETALGYTAQSLVAHTKRRKAMPSVNFVSESPVVTRVSGGTEPDMNTCIGPDKPAEVAAGEHVTPSIPPNEI